MRSPVVTSTLTRLIAEAQVLAGGDHPCAILGHKWTHIGGRWCGCQGSETWGCSVPVRECESCGDCDYGDNEDADEIKSECEIALSTRRAQELAADGLATACSLVRLRRRANRLLREALPKPIPRPDRARTPALAAPTERDSSKDQNQ